MRKIAIDDVFSRDGGGSEGVAGNCAGAEMVSFRFAMGELFMRTGGTSKLIALSVVVPCYNESGNIAELWRRVTEACRDQVGIDYEIVLVNDGSKDASWAEMKALREGDPRIVAVNLSRNYGHQIALSAGLSLAKGQRVLILDADLQDPPELLSKMMPLMDSGADVVYGVRTGRLAESWFKRTSANLFYRFLAQIIDVPIPVDTGDFRLISRRAIDILIKMPEQHRFIRGMISWIGLVQVPIHYRRQPRYFGETKYPLSKMVKFALDAVTGFSVRPLRIASYFGIVSALSALVVLLYAIYRWLTGQVVVGWTSLVIVALLLGAAQLIVLGIIGEYLGRLYMESKQRPLFVIQDVLDRQLGREGVTLNAETRSNAESFRRA